MFKIMFVLKDVQEIMQNLKIQIIKFVIINVNIILKIVINIV